MFSSTGKDREIHAGTLLAVHASSSSRRSERREVPGAVEETLVVSFQTSFGEPDGDQECSWEGVGTYRTLVPAGVMSMLMRACRVVNNNKDASHLELEIQTLRG